MLSTFHDDMSPQRRGGQSIQYVCGTLNTLFTQHLKQ